MDNSPLVLAFAQLVVLILNALLYARQKSAVDVEKRDRGAFGRDVQQALQLATTAKQDVDKIDVEHYRRLAALFSAQASELEAAKAKILALEESVASLSNKLASRDRADKAYEKRAAVQAAKEDSAAEASGEVDLDELIRRHGTRLAPMQPAAPAAAPNTFGKTAR